MNKKINIGLIQMTSGIDPEANVIKIKKYLKEAEAKQIKYVFLPECFLSLSDGNGPTPHQVAEGNELFLVLQNLAKSHKVYLLGGSVATKNDNSGQLGIQKKDHQEKLLPFNRCYNFDPEGKVIGIYDKMNLFSCDLSRHESKKVLDEHRLYTPGTSANLLTVGPLKIGLNICFDLRFPELARYYSGRGANLLSYSSAFTVPTGKAHWHTLLRARAIENQCYVVAAAQVGVHNEKMSTFGHSLMIDPWGEILIDAQRNEGFFHTEIDLEHLSEVRSRLNVLRPISY
jgi:predicted amidohydrolase